MATNNAINLSDAGVVSYDGAGDFIGSVITQHDVLVAGATNAIVSVSPSTAGFVLTSNGPSVDPSFQAPASDVNLTITHVNAAASPYTVLSSDEFIAVDSSAGNVSIVFPNTTSTGRVIYVKDSNGTSATFSITLTTVGGTVTIDGQTTYSIVSNYASVNLIFDATNYEVF